MKILKEEFLRELQFLSDVFNGRAHARSTFTEQLVNQLKAVASLAPDPNISAVISVLGGVAVFAANRSRDGRISTVTDLSEDLDIPRLEVLLDVVAREALRRYESFIIDRLSEGPMKGVVPFARVGARRMLEHISRHQRQDPSEPLISESILLAGLVEGRSGAWIQGFSNTSLELKQMGRNRLGQEKPKTIEAEVVYARPGFRSFEMKSGTLQDKLYLRGKPAKHQAVPAWGKAKHLIKGNTDAFYNFGYVQFRKTAGYSQDPKAGYVLMPLSVIQTRYGFKEQKQEAMSAALRAELRSSSHSLLVIDRATLENYIKFYPKFWAIDPVHVHKGLMDYVREKLRRSARKRSERDAPWVAVGPDVLLRLSVRS